MIQGPSNARFLGRISKRPVIRRRLRRRHITRPGRLGRFSVGLGVRALCHGDGRHCAAGHGRSDGFAVAGRCVWFAGLSGLSGRAGDDGTGAAGRDSDDDGGVDCLGGRARAGRLAVRGLRWEGEWWGGYDGGRLTWGGGAAGVFGLFWGGGRRRVAWLWCGVSGGWRAAGWGCAGVDDGDSCGGGCDVGGVG